MRVIVLTKRQYTNRDVIDDRYGRLWEIPRELVRNGHDVTCVCLSYRKKNSGEETFLESDGSKIRWISVDLGTFFIVGLLKYLFTVLATLRREKPDVVWSCSDSIYVILGYYLSRVYKCRSVVDLYDNFESFASYKFPILGYLFRRAVCNSDGVSCVSERLKTHITQNYGRMKPTTVVTNAVDKQIFCPRDKIACREQLGLPQDVVLIGSAGDMSSHRGADIIFTALIECPREFVSSQIAIAGFRSSTTTIPKAENIHDFGILAFEDVPVLLNSLDLAVIYNRQSVFGEYCFPQKFYEVLSCGIPIIGADVGELGVLLKDQPHLLYEDENVASFVRAMNNQLAHLEMPDVAIPTWRDQARLLDDQMQAIVECD